MVGVALEVGRHASLELGQHDNMEHVGRRETSLSADVEQLAHRAHTNLVKTHDVCGEAQEFLVEDGLFGCQGLGELGVVQLQQIDSTGVASDCVSTIRHGVMHCLRGHVVDGLHDEAVKLDGEGLVDLVENHVDEAHHLGGRTERRLDLTLCDRVLNLESHAAGEELGFGLGLMEHIGVIGRTICKFPRLVLGSDRHLAGNLFQNGAVLPTIHQNGRGRPLIGSVDKHYFADVVDEGFDVVVVGSGVEGLFTHVNKTCKVYGLDGVFANNLLLNSINDSSNLFNSHYNHSFHVFSPDVWT